VAYQHLLRAERVPVRASRRWVGDPLPSAIPNEIADRGRALIEAWLWFVPDRPARLEAYDVHGVQLTSANV
jgi:hypothetical protein